MQFGMGGITSMEDVGASSSYAMVLTCRAKLGGTPPQTTVASPAKHVKADADKRAEVTWLKGIVRARPGWMDFFKGMNRNLQNPDAVRSWKFAVAFSEEYNKAESDVSGVLIFHFCLISADILQAQRSKPILKNSINKALLHGSTWMSGAERAVHILNVYGEGRSRPAQEVIDKVRYRTRVGEDAPGSGVLLQWLIKWDQEHK